MPSRRPSRVTSRPRARRQTVLADVARAAAVPQREAVLQDRLHLASPGAVGGERPAERTVSGAANGRFCGAHKWPVLNLFHRGRGHATIHAMMSPSRKEQRIRCPLLEGDLEPWIRCCTRRFLPLARRITGDDDHAHDVLHESWVIVLEKLYQYRGSPPACGWVATIVRHEASHSVVTRSRLVPLPDVDLPAAELPPEATAYAAELRRLLMQAIDELPPTFQEVVRLRDIEGRPNAEVARQLHISQRNVATRLHRAHRLLRRRLQGHR